MTPRLHHAGDFDRQLIRVPVERISLHSAGSVRVLTAAEDEELATIAALITRHRPRGRRLQRGHHASARLQPAAPPHTGAAPPPP
ncbi:hypothetical protein, partial [Paracoccus solventivorans]|uniref:hypothetical protein n=1 Tax=Paracoccus solventivorans TaxID=53463 RepID=UPI0026EFC3EC